MKINKLLLFVLISLLFLPQAAVSAELRSGQEVQIKQNQIIEENFYSVSTNFSHFGTAKKDLFAVAETISSSGTTTKDQFLAGANINIEGNLQEDLRAVGGEITISGPVEGETVLIGSKVNIEPEAKLNQETIILANKLNLEGKINKKARIFAREIFIDGEVGGNLQANTLIFNITKNAVIGGDLNYSADTKADIPKQTKVEGAINFTPSESSLWPFQKKDKNFRQTLISKFDNLWWLSLLAELMAGLVLFWLFKRKIKKINSSTYYNFGRNILIGLAVLVLSPVVLIGLFSSVVGFWISILLALIGGIFLILSKVGGGILLGSLLRKLILKEDRFKLDWNSVAGGIVALSLVSVIPFLGSFVETLFSTAVFGTLVCYFYSYLFNSGSSNKK
ncbi:MAG: hypothetical protein BRC22_01220 [Parcubacteria group bacterium QH_9_35_7]|nr:MAG: hypothetical protein BRC22_01220 [Parcubacteria group bacterium QH_9_35_7]